MKQRIAEELGLLRRIYPGLSHQEAGGEDWFLLPDYLFPVGWSCGGVPFLRGPVAFKLGATYPDAAPYAFHAPAGLTYGSSAPTNATAANGVPFPGEWLLFSWQPDGNWTPKARAEEGSNLLAWVRSFTTRLKEGA